MILRTVFEGIGMHIRSYTTIMPVEGEYLVKPDGSKSSVHLELAAAILGDARILHKCLEYPTWFWARFEELLISKPVNQNDMVAAIPRVWHQAMPQCFYEFQAAGKQQFQEAVEYYSTNHRNLEEYVHCIYSLSSD
jgi:hypothetical protein